MSPFNDPLRKILELERAKKYADSVVIGGLDKYLKKWIADAHQRRDSSPVFDFLAGSPELAKGYYTLDPTQRQAFVEKALNLTDGASASVTEGPKSSRGGSRLKPAGEPSPSRQPRPPAAARSASPAKPGQPLPASEPSPSAPSPAVGMDIPIAGVKGIGPSLAARFKRLGVTTIKDMLYFFPRRHLDYSKTLRISQLREGDEQTIVGTVWEAREARMGNRKATEAVIADDSGSVRVVWFNQPYIARQLRTNARVVISGRVGIFRNRPVFESPEWEILDDKDLVHTGRLIPVYPLTSGLSPRTARRIVKDAVDRWAGGLPDFLPPVVKSRCNLMDLPDAVRQAHYPESEDLKRQARRRLAFDELFILQLGVLSQKQNWQSASSTALKSAGGPTQNFVACLPFALTGAQQRALKEILEDMSKDKPMARLLQGDVGSGKTVVATVAMLTAAFNGCQAALMAPTEILSEQHFQSVGRLLAKCFGIEAEEKYVKKFTGPSGQLTLALLVGGTGKADRERLRTGIASGEINLAIGTHALIQKDISFRDLGLAVVDEQHRFGVEQRSTLHKKGHNPHLLVMTATPIPRTLALTLYGDLDLTVIDEMPAGRQVIKTKWLGPGDRDKAYAFIRRRVAEGRQAFVICPLIEESEAIEAKAATTEFLRLSTQVFPDLRLCLLHGKMKNAEKDDAMRRFRDAETDILVSTAVVEVGVDVPNATVMLIEGADRFGLSQLHQFRGRVGRGQHQSYCVLLAENPSPESQERLSVIERVFNGFILAEEDLRLRGPGEFFGTRQSGLPDLKMARLTDTILLEMARSQALALFKRDPMLQQPPHRLLRQEVVRVWGSGLNLKSNLV